jgi:hypothetical protein
VDVNTLAGRRRRGRRAASAPVYAAPVNVDLFAGVRVSDIGAARPWYERLLGGEPAFLPNEIEAVWSLAEHQYLYLLEDRPGAGRALVTVMVDDLDATVAALAARGIEADESETFPGGARATSIRSRCARESTGVRPSDAPRCSTRRGVRQSTSDRAAADTMAPCSRPVIMPVARSSSVTSSTWLTNVP